MTTVFSLPVRLLDREQRPLARAVVAAEAVEELRDRARLAARARCSRTRALPVGASSSTPSLAIALQRTSAPSTDVLPVPARPTRTPSRWVVIRLQRLLPAPRARRRGAGCRGRPRRLSCGSPRSAGRAKSRPTDGIALRGPLEQRPREPQLGVGVGRELERVKLLGEPSSSGRHLDLDLLDDPRPGSPRCRRTSRAGRRMVARGRGARSASAPRPRSAGCRPPPRRAAAR